MHTIWGDTPIVHRRTRSSSNPLLAGFIDRCQAFWNSKRACMQCYAFIGSIAVWIARVDLQTYDQLINKATEDKERRFSVALNHILPRGTKIHYNSKYDKRTQTTLYFVADRTVDDLTLLKIISAQSK